MDEALTPSLFSQSRALMVTNAEKLTKGRLGALSELHSVPNSSLKIVLVGTPSKAADGWSKGFPIVEIDPVRAADAARWLVDRFKVVPDVARYLVEAVGMDLCQLNTEMEKLQTYAGHARPVEIRDVDVLILRSEQYGPFELDDSVLARDYARSVRIVGTMLDDGMEPLLILSRIVRVWRQLFVGKGLTGKKSAKEVATIAGAPAWKAGDFVAACRKHEAARLAQGFRELLNADRAFKTSTDPRIYFDVLLWKLIG